MAVLEALLVLVERQEGAEQALSVVSRRMTNDLGLLLTFLSGGCGGGGGGGFGGCGGGGVKSFLDGYIFQ